MYTQAESVRRGLFFCADCVKWRSSGAVPDIFVTFGRSGRSSEMKGNLKAYLAGSVINRARDRAQRQGFGVYVCGWNDASKLPLRNFEKGHISGARIYASDVIIASNDRCHDNDGTCGWLRMSCSN